MLLPKVLLVSQEVAPETGWGGIGSYVAHLADALAALGCEVHVLSVVPGQSVSTRPTDSGAFVHRRPLRRPRGISTVTRLPHTWDRLSLAVAVRRQVHRLESSFGVFDVVECPDWMAEGLVLTFRRRPPVVVRLHSSLDQTSRFLADGGLDRSMAKRLERWQIGRADLLIGTEHVLSETRAARPAVAIPCPVPSQRVTELVAAPPTISFIGRFEDRKGVEVLVRALPTVVAALPRVRLRLVGRDTLDGSGRSVLSRVRALAAQLGVEEALEVVDDWQSPDEIAEHLRSSTVCAVPSRWESFGYTAAEAASHGRPVLASDIPPLRALVVPGVTGHLLPPDDDGAWSTALIDVLSDLERAQRMGCAGARHVAERCAPSEVAEQTLRAYARVVARGDR